MDCSILICTRNRAESLRQTLRSFENVAVPVGWQVELIVADNGSSDSTEQVIAESSLENLELKRLPVPEQGKSRAQNAAVRAALSDVLLFTDDDVTPEPDWLHRMAEPLISRQCEAVAGSIVLSKELSRSWLTPMHRRWLAEVLNPSGDYPELVGANMGIHRSVFDSIDLFDEELGPGITGFGEETLLWMQMKEAGMRIQPCISTHVTHHPDPSRLRYASWLTAVRNHGRTQAYISHHWKHETLPNSMCRARWIRLKLATRRAINSRRAAQSDGCPEWEMCYEAKAAMLEEMSILSELPRKYALRGLRKLN